MIKLQPFGKTAAIFPPKEAGKQMAQQTIEKSEGEKVVKRNIIEINEEKCNGCGECIPNCPEGALQIIDGKARLVSDLSCDGLGACIGHCPLGAIKIIEREAEPYDERKVMENIAKQGENVIKAHLEHLKGHGQHQYLKQAVQFLEEKGIENPILEGEEHQKQEHPYQEHERHGHESHGHMGGCPGAKMMQFKKEKQEGGSGKQESMLGQWPVQIHLVPVKAPFFENADLLISADCIPFAFGNFHSDLLQGKALAIGCPKLDDIGFYREKLGQIFRENNLKSVTVAIMEVPCCSGLLSAVEQALEESGKDIPLDVKIVKISGGLQSD